MSDLSCPKCSHLLLPREEDGFTVDRCGGCGGQWFDYLALDAAVKRWLPARHVGNVGDFMNPHDSRPIELACPRCAAPLHETEQAGVTVEWCRSCRGLFLDAGELGKIRQWRLTNFACDMGNVAKEAGKRAAKEAAAAGLVLAINSRLNTMVQMAGDGAMALRDLVLWVHHRGKSVDKEEKNAYERWLETGEY